MGTDDYVCPVCGQPVATVVRRHKTLGAFVPVWGPGPCRNPKCEAYVEDAVDAVAEKPWAVARRTHGTHAAKTERKAVEQVEQTAEGETEERG
ncbi:hypothetical protein [Streptomyces capitiformicae]|uniref:Uncharacterized protein n=1 Tax=Streptomyces capitiformicae TaxID=2014920 RepID=A0A919LET7_9ACTN|nr:hypothetical protein [Streptomyces capitiformicae]GHH89586.1 hypothetical protein GCM10017771_40970 [Streptomyces capitiformicae]